MNITEELKKLAQKISDAAESLSQQEAPDIRIRKTFPSGARFCLRVRASSPSLDLEGLGQEELAALLKEYRQKLEALQSNEPEDDNSGTRIAWEDAEDDLKDQIRDLENALQDQLCDLRNDLQNQLDELEDKMDNLEDIEPEEEDSKAHDAWQILVEALDEEINQLQDTLDALEEQIEEIQDASNNMDC